MYDIRSMSTMHNKRHLSFNTHKRSARHTYSRKNEIDDAIDACDVINLVDIVKWWRRHRRRWQRSDCSLCVWQLWNEFERCKIRCKTNDWVQTGEWNDSAYYTRYGYCSSRSSNDAHHQYVRAIKLIIISLFAQSNWLRMCVLCRVVSNSIRCYTRLLLLLVAQLCTLRCTFIQILQIDNYVFRIFVLSRG